MGIRMKNPNAKISPGQRSYLLSLLEGRECPEDARDRLMKALRISEDPEEFGMSMGKAGEAIDWLKMQPQRTRQGQLAGMETAQNKTKIDRPGVFEVPEGVFLVKMNRAGTHLYAMKMVPAASDRLTEAGDGKKIEFEFLKGAMRLLGEEDRMPKERAKELTVVYGRCLVCNRKLERKESVERGIGPVCIKAFA